MKRAWISLTICLFCVCTLGAVLYGGAEGMDDGSGWISVSPGADILFWGSFILLSGILSVVFFVVCKPGLLRVPEALQFPAAYAATLGVLSVLVVLIGAAGLLPGYQSVLDLPIRIPFWLYATLAAAAYLGIGCFYGKRSSAELRINLLWGLAFTIVLVLLGIAALQARWKQLQPIYNGMVQQWQDCGMSGIGFVNQVAETAPGAVLARLNLPANVLLGIYETEYYDLFPLLNLEPAISLLAERVITILTCLFPPLLFTGGWALAWLRRT